MAEPSTYSTDTDFNNNFHGRTSDYQTAVWFENVLHGKDQLRQRVAFALSELFVISASKQRIRFRGDSLASYYDILARNAFGNFRTIMGEVSKSPGMGIFLSHQGNKKFTSSSNTHPDENYARELMQLFSLGLWKMNQDGSMVKDSTGNPVPSYTQDDVEELAKVMTGYDLKGNDTYGRTHRGNGEEWSSPMEFNSTHHEYGSKTFLGSTIASENVSENDPPDSCRAGISHHVPAYGSMCPGILNTQTFVILRLRVFHGSALQHYCCCCCQASGIALMHACLRSGVTAAS